MFTTGLKYIGVAQLVGCQAENLRVPSSRLAKVDLAFCPLVINKVLIKMKICGVFKSSVGLSPLSQYFSIMM